MLQLLSSFKNYFLKLRLNVLRFLVRLNVSGVLFQNVGPIYDKASWLVLVLWIRYFNFWELPLNWKFFSLALSKTLWRKLGHCSFKYLKRTALTHCLNLYVRGNQFKRSNSSWGVYNYIWYIYIYIWYYDIYLIYIHTHTHTYIYIYIYIFILMRSWIMRYIVSNQNTFASLNLFKFANSNQMVIECFLVYSIIFLCYIPHIRCCWFLM